MKEFKILEFRQGQKTPSYVEKTLADKSAEGWEVKSMISDEARGAYVVLLQRDKATGDE